MSEDRDAGIKWLEEMAERGDVDQFYVKPKPKKAPSKESEEEES